MMTPKPQIVRIGTRASPLALIQAEDIAARLKTASNGEIACELVKFTTTGDKLTTERLINAGGKGLFTKELDRALDDGEIDIGVHSLKDVPSQLPDGHVFVAFPEREDTREGFVCPAHSRLADLPGGAVLGTASLRREAQALRARPDLNVVPFRGNVQTRMRKLEEGQAAATFLAMAGLNRLGMAHLAHPIPTDDMLSAPCQGIVGVTARAGVLPLVVRDALSAITSEDSRRAQLAERAFLRELDGSCRTPIAALLARTAEGWTFRGEVLSPDGTQCWQASGTLDADPSDSALVDLGIAAGQEIRAAAGGDLPAFEDDA